MTTLPYFVGVAWGWPTARGRQRVHVVVGPSDVEVNSLCGADVRVWRHGPGLDSHPATGMDEPGRSMVTCAKCRRAVRGKGGVWRR